MRSPGTGVEEGHGVFEAKKTCEVSTAQPPKGLNSSPCSQVRLRTRGLPITPYILLPRQRGSPPTRGTATEAGMGPAGTALPWLTHGDGSTRSINSTPIPLGSHPSAKGRSPLGVFPAPTPLFHKCLPRNVDNESRLISAH